MELRWRYTGMGNPPMVLEFRSSAHPEWTKVPIEFHLPLTEDEAGWLRATKPADNLTIIR